MSRRVHNSIIRLTVTDLFSVTSCCGDTPLECPIFQAISRVCPQKFGRSVLAGTELLVKLVRSRGFHSVTIVADGDAPGWNGAKRLAAALPVPARLILPPPGIKDLRRWIAKMD